MTGIFLDHIHGAATGADPDATAFPHRQPGFSVLLLRQCAEPAEAAMTAWVRDTFHRLGPRLSAGRYTNILSADDAGVVRQGYGELPAAGRRSTRP